MASRFFSFLRGREAEHRARRFLKSRGFRIIESNVVIGGGEIDIVALDHSTLVFVEVRFRAEGLGAAAASVDRAKRRTLAGAVLSYRMAEGLMAVACRQDLLLVTKTPEWLFELQVGMPSETNNSL